MRDTQHFHCGLLLSTTQQKKSNSEKHTEIFLEILIFLKQAKEVREKQERENYLHGKAPNKQRKSFWVFFLVLQLKK